MFDLRPLSQAELDDFLAFMGGPAFATNPQWAGCYCQFYLNAPGEENTAADRGDTNRQKACDRIASGAMRGYLAYQGTEVIGWVAANKANNFQLLPATDDSAARILCFVIDAKHHGKGVSTALLNFAIDDLTKQGFKSIEAAPKSSENFDPAGYRGKLSTFLKAGFIAGPQLDDSHVLVTKVLGKSKN